MAKQNTRPADSGDMYAVHTVFRGEFAAMPALVRGVAAQDRARTRIVSDHVAFIIDMLHLHHHSEDEHCWPKVAERGAEEAGAVADLMRSQHQVIDTALQAAERHNAAWRESASALDRDALADAIDALSAPLDEHLQAEEKNMLPLIDRFLTADEWADVGNKALADIPWSKVPVVFGMVLRDATDAQRALFKENMPTPVFAVMSKVGPVAYRRYRRKLYGAG